MWWGKYKADSADRLASAERDHEHVKSRRPMIESLVAQLAEAREVNHFALRIEQAYAAKRGK